MIDDLRAAISAACPITSLTIGDPNNRSSWHIEFDPSATAEQQAAADNVLANFVPLDESEQMAAQKMAAGLAVNSTSVPALNGTYALDPVTQANIQAVAVYALVNPGKFPAGQTALPWPDIYGTLHVFPSTTVFLAFATAVADYVAALKLAATQPSPSWPASTVMIP